MAMNAVRDFIRNTIASRNSVFRLMSARTQASSATPAPASKSAAYMVFIFASTSEVKLKEKRFERFRQIDVPTMSGNMGILGMFILY